MKRVVITGGPAGGKSTVIRYLTERHSPNMAFVPEAATLLLSGGFPAPDATYPWSESWQRNFQEVVAATQVSLEQTYSQRAIQAHKQLLICDRGLVDGAAYLHGGIRELSNITQQEPSNMFDRYDLVIHLTTSAKQSTGYQKHTNPHRFEKAAQAIALDTRTYEAWQNHPNLHVLDIVDETERNQHVAAMVLRLLA